MSNDERELVSIVKVRDNGGNAAITIPRHIFRKTKWLLGAQQVLVQYDEDADRIIVSPVDISKVLGG